MSTLASVPDSIRFARASHHSNWYLLARYQNFNVFHSLAAQTQRAVPSQRCDLEMAAAVALLARRCTRLSRRFATITDPAAPSFATPIGAGSITPSALDGIPGRAAQVERLKHDTPFDVVVVGGGCVGAGAALDAAARGLRVALVERGDYQCINQMSRLLRPRHRRDCAQATTAPRRLRGPPSCCGQAYATSRRPRPGCCGGNRSRNR